MQRDQIIEILKQEIHQAGWDIKAEALLAAAIEKGLQTDDCMISCDRRFRREYSKDIISAEVKENDGLQKLLNIHLSRSGIYDQLPEGIFFQSRKRMARAESVTSMSADFKLNRKKEEAIRRFFSPFENDFFLQRLGIEEEEILLLEGLRSGILNEYFVRFWDLPRNLPKPFIGPLLLLLPHAYKIAGDQELTAQCLELLLRENAEVKLKASTTINAAGINPPRTGEAVLGLDMVCGENFWDGTPSLVIEIGPLENSQVQEYLEGGARNILLETFKRFFIPAESDVEIILKVSPEKQHMKLEKGGGPELGYSSVLGGVSGVEL